MFVYIIYSDLNKRFYHGMTHDLEERLDTHNMGKVKSTKAFVPWRIIYIEEFKNIESAMKSELYFKSGAGKFPSRYIPI